MRRIELACAAAIALLCVSLVVYACVSGNAGSGREEAWTGTTAAPVSYDSSSSSGMPWWVWWHLGRSSHSSSPPIEIHHHYQAPTQAGAKPAPGFDDFTAERERGLRAEGLFDVADMYRELRERLLMGVKPSGPPFDCESFDRGRTTALLKLLDSFPNGLIFYTESGEELTVDEAMVVGGWLPKRRANRG